MWRRNMGLPQIGPGVPSTRTARRCSRICSCVFPSARCLATPPRYVRQRIPPRPAPAKREGPGDRLSRGPATWPPTLQCLQRSGPLVLGRGLRAEEVGALDVTHRFGERGVAQAPSHVLGADLFDPGPDPPDVAQRVATRPTRSPKNRCVTSVTEVPPAATALRRTSPASST